MVSRICVERWGNRPFYIDVYTSVCGGQATNHLKITFLAKSFSFHKSKTGVRPHEFVSLLAAKTQDTLILSHVISVAAMLHCKN